jgi:hypothetical protein
MTHTQPINTQTHTHTYIKTLRNFSFEKKRDKLMETIYNNLNQ